MCIHAPAKARLTFPGAGRALPGPWGHWIPLAHTLRARKGGDLGGIWEGFIGVLSAHEWFTCVVHSVISTGVVPARLSYFIAVCSLLFSSRSVILHVFVLSVLLSILPRRGEGGGRQ